MESRLLSSFLVVALKCCDSPQMPFKARVVMFLFGGLLFGGGAVVATGNLMDVSSGDMTTAVVAGLVDGLGLALLLIARVADEL